MKLLLTYVYRCISILFYFFYFILFYASRTYANQPAQRRRTQIRLAQRAYRHRKESTIQTLEARVRELQENNERMNSAFMRLYDFALSRRIFETQPEFARELQATTQLFVSLASQASQGAGQDSARGDAGDSSATFSARQPHRADARTLRQAAGNNGGPSPDMSSNGRGPSETNHLGGQRILYGGIVVTHEPEPQYSSSAASHRPTTTASSWSSPPPASQPAPATEGSSASAAAHESATRPTVRDASFPFGMSSACDSINFTTATTTTTTTTTHDRTPQAAPLLFLAGADPYAALALQPPASFSHFERTFGRRLQRFALEKGLWLLSLQDPPPTFYAAVFGFCLLFESKQRIMERIANCLSVNQRENLCNWRSPFLHLGGAGTFFPELNDLDTVDLAASMHQAGAGIVDPAAGIEPQDHQTNNDVVIVESTARSDCRPDGLPLGNRGTVDRHRYHLGRDARFGPGPWDPLVEETRDMRVDHKMRITTPGFEGDFYDCDEVEWYLRTRGVVISPGADKVTAEVAVDAFAPGRAQAEGNSIPDRWTGDSVGEWPGHRDDGLAGDVSGLDAVGGPMWTGSAGLGPGSGLANPAVGSGAFDEMPLGSMAAASLGRPMTPAPDKRTVTIDVDLLVQGMLSFVLIFFLAGRK